MQINGPARDEAMETVGELTYISLGALLHVLVKFLRLILEPGGRQGAYLVKLGHAHTRTHTHTLCRFCIQYFGNA